MNPNSPLMGHNSTHVHVIIRDGRYLFSNVSIGLQNSWYELIYWTPHSLSLTSCKIGLPSRKITQLNQHTPIGGVSLTTSPTTFQYYYGETLLTKSHRKKQRIMEYPWNYIPHFVGYSTPYQPWVLQPQPLNL